MVSTISSFGVCASVRFKTCFNTTLILKALFVLVSLSTHIIPSAHFYFDIPHYHRIFNMGSTINDVCTSSCEALWSPACFVYWVNDRAIFLWKYETDVTETHTSATISASISIHIVHIVHIHIFSIPYLFLSSLVKHYCHESVSKWKIDRPIFLNPFIW